MVLGSPVLPPPQPLRASIPVAAAAPKARRVSADPARGEPSEPGSIRIESGWIERRRWWVGVSGGGGSDGRGRCGLCALTPAIITHIVRPPQGATGRWRGTRRVPQRSHGPLLLVIPCQLRLSIR